MNRAERRRTARARKNSGPNPVLTEAMARHEPANAALYHDET